jgi:c-di-GMP-binding flagellar brake protein YcgR
MPPEIDIKFLAKAIEENENITIVVDEDRKKRFVYRSRFFDIDKTDNTIIIDIATGEGDTYEPLTKGDKIKVYFQYSGFRFYFHSKVLGKFKYSLNENVKTAAFKIKTPSKLKDGERRNYFRVPAPMDKPIIVKFILYPKGAEHVVLNEDDPDGNPRVFEATLFDISGNGVALKSDSKDEFDINDKIDMRFRLDKEDFDELKISGIIRNKRSYYGTDIPLYGIEFIHDRSVEFKRALNKISKFVMKRQREILA